MTKSLIIANEFIRLSMRDEVLLKRKHLEALVYIAYGLSLLIDEDKPPLLGREIPYAWSFGPVFKKLHESLRIKMYENPIKLFNLKGRVEDVDFLNLIEAVWDEFGCKSELSVLNFITKESTPYYLTWKKERFSIISVDITRSYYSELISKLDL